jgi:hypothetical protein
MQLTVAVPDDSEATLALSQWCRRDPELRGIRIAVLSPPARPGEMGLVGEALAFVSDNDALLTAVATTVGTWLGTRTVRTRIRVKLGDKEIEIESRSPGKAQEIAARIVAELDEAPPPESD